MTKETLAATLTGREYTNEITETEEKLAKDTGLVVIFGASDDLCELRGAGHDEVDVYDGGTVLVNHAGNLLADIDSDDIEVLERYGVFETVQALRDAAIKVEALWCKEPGYAWTYKTDAPHATFEIMKDDEYYCRGIVIDLKEVRKP